MFKQILLPALTSIFFIFLGATYAYSTLAYTPPIPSKEEKKLMNKYKSSKSSAQKNAVTEEIKIHCAKYKKLVIAAAEQTPIGCMRMLMGKPAARNYDVLDNNNRGVLGIRAIGSGVGLPPK